MPHKILQPAVLQQAAIWRPLLFKIEFFLCIVRSASGLREMRIVPSYFVVKQGQFEDNVIAVLNL